MSKEQETYEYVADNGDSMRFAKAKELKVGDKFLENFNLGNDETVMAEIVDIKLELDGFTYTITWTYDEWEYANKTGHKETVISKSRFNENRLFLVGDWCIL